jgi:stalled ribosome alternative rescue factor ArfA
MKTKPLKIRKKSFAIKSNPEFGMRVVKSKKGRGSYDRKVTISLKEVFLKLIF